MPASRPGRLTLGREQRLRQSGEFARVKAGGQRLVWGCLILNWLARPAGSGSRLGVVTSRKMGGAVARSRARRLMREAWRRHQHELAQPADVVLIARRSIVGMPFEKVEATYLKLLHQTGLRPAVPSADTNA